MKATDAPGRMRMHLAMNYHAMAAAKALLAIRPVLETGGMKNIEQNQLTL